METVTPNTTKLMLEIEKMIYRHGAMQRIAGNLMQQDEATHDLTREQSMQLDDLNAQMRTSFWEIFNKTFELRCIMKDEIPF